MGLHIPSLAELRNLRSELHRFQERLVAAQLIILIAFSIGLGMNLGVLNVFFRDIGYFYSVALQFWFWLTPIVYSVNILPEKIRFLVSFNPLTNLATSERAFSTASSALHPYA